MEFDICEEREICPACHYHDVNAHRAPQLCDADQWYFYFFSCCQGKVGIFLDDYYDIRHIMMVIGRFQLAFVVSSVIILNVLALCFTEQFMPPFRQGIDASNRICCLKIFDA